MTKIKKIALWAMMAVLTICFGFAAVFASIPMKAKATPITVSMLDGVSLKLDKESPALRWFAEIEGVNSECVYGMLIMKETEYDAYDFDGDYHEVLTAAEGEYSDVICVPFVQTVQGETGNYIRAGIDGIDDIYEKYIAIAYVKNTENVYSYATVNKAGNSKCVMEVALGAELLDREWSAEDKSVLNYYHELYYGAETQVVVDRFSGDSINPAVWELTDIMADGNVYASVTGVAGEVKLRTSDSYSDITSIQFDIQLLTSNAWWGITTADSAYATPVLITDNAISGNGATLTGATYWSDSPLGMAHLTGNWMTYKYVVTGADTGELWVAKQGGTLVKTHDITGSNKDLRSGKIGITTGGSDNYCITNIIITTSSATYTETFDGEYSIFALNSNVEIVDDRVRLFDTDNYAYARVVSPTPELLYKTSVSYSDISYVQFDIKFTSANAWWAMTNAGVYSGPALLTQTAISGNKAALSGQTYWDNAIGVSSLVNTWVTYKYVVTGETTAELYVGLKGSQMAKTHDLTFTDDNKGSNLTSGTFGIATAGADSFLLDNVIIVSDNGATTTTETFDGDTTIFAANANVEIVKAINGVSLAENSVSKFFSSGAIETTDGASPNSDLDYLTTASNYTGVTALGFKARFDGTGMLYFRMGTSYWSQPLQFYNNKVVVAAGSAVDANDSAITTYNFDFTKWTQVDFKNASDEGYELWLNGEKVLTGTLTAVCNGFKPTTGGDLMFTKSAGTFVFELDDIYITTASGTVSEDFNAVTDETHGVTDSKPYTEFTFTIMKTYKVRDVFGDAICVKNGDFDAISEFEATKITAKETVSIDAAAASDKVIAKIAVDYKATVGGGFGIGIGDNTIVSVHFKEGDYSVKLNDSGVYGDTQKSLSSLNGTVTVSVYKNGDILISDGVSETVVGDLNLGSGFAVSLFNFNASGSVNLTNISVTEYSFA